MPELLLSFSGRRGRRPLQILLFFRSQAAENTADAVKRNECERDQNDLTDLDKGYRCCSEERAAEEDHQYLDHRDQEHYDDERAVLPYIRQYPHPLTTSRKAVKDPEKNKQCVECCEEMNFGAAIEYRLEEIKL